jgi:hypothetical protein
LADAMGGGPMLQGPNKFFTIKAIHDLEVCLLLNKEEGEKQRKDAIEFCILL